MQNLQQQLHELRSLIHHYNHHYYVLNNPVVSDAYYDETYKQLKQLEAQYPEFSSEESPTFLVGSDLSASFETIKHDFPMLSLSNVYNKEELQGFVSKIPVRSFVVEPKYDGVSLSLTYKEDGTLQGLTRGDGLAGEDVTVNVKTISNIPHQLTGENGKRITIRGEVVMPKNVFNRLNKEREKKGEDLFANPRNAASGALKLKNPQEVAKRRLFFLPYSVEGIDAVSHEEGLLWLRQQNFTVQEFSVSTNFEGIYEHIQHIEETRETYPFELDGAVVKVNSYSAQHQLGATSKAPRWAVAYKYPAEKKKSTVQSIRWTLGRSGAYTPTVVVDPISLSGTTVSYATLHHASWYQQLNVCPGDEVLLHKAGEIIPEVLGVIKKTEDVAILPTHCPSCEEVLVFKNPLLVCENPNCEEKIIQGMIHALSKDALDGGGFGEKMVRLLFAHKKIHALSDVFSLTKEDFLSLPRVGEKTANNALSAIEEMKNKEGYRYLYALGIPNVGRSLSKQLMALYGHIPALYDQSLQQLENLEGVGPITAYNLYEGLRKNKELLANLHHAGCNLGQRDHKQEQVDHPYAGKTFVFTGTLSKSRSYYEEWLKSRGAILGNAVSKKTYALVIGEKAGSKAEKAKQMGILVLTEQDLLEEK